MKTRIFYTKFWYDSYVLSLNPKERLLFNFLITNERIGLSPYYEISTGLIKLATGLTNAEIARTKVKFTKDVKLVFFRDWVWIVNLERYQAYKGEKNEKAKERELELIPIPVKKHFDGYTIDRVSVTPDTPRNHKSEIINKKEGGSGGEERLDFTKKVIDGLKAKFPDVDVGVELETARDWLASTGKVKKNYLAFFRNWLRRSSARQRLDKKKGGGAVDATGIK